MYNSMMPYSGGNLGPETRVAAPGSFKAAATGSTAASMQSSDPVETAISGVHAAR